METENDKRTLATEVLAFVGELRGTGTFTS
jgi:hypothetical protein